MDSSANLFVTPDGRYLVVRGRLWRATNPALSQELRSDLVKQLMYARREKGKAMRASNTVAKETARQAVDDIKQQLGERGAPWWTDGAPDLNRKMVKNTIYAEWYASVNDRNEHGV